MKKQFQSIVSKVGAYARAHPFLFAIGILLIVLAAFFRLYRVGEFVVFLGDQGRDAITMKRLITFENLPAIGAPSSVGQIFLGPFYYYFAAPFLLLFGFNPVGPAYGVAITSLLGLIIAWYIVKKETSIIPSLIFLFLGVFSGVSISLARFSWNPNLLPFFSFFTLYLFHSSLRHKSALLGGAFGLMYAFSTQLHHLAFLIAVPCMVVFAYVLFQKRERKNDLLAYIRIAVSAVVLFFVGNAPLILFDLKNRFINIQSYFRLFSGQEHTEEATAWIYRLHETVGNFFFHMFQFHADPWVWYTILALFTGLFLYTYFSQRDKNLFILLNFLLIPLYLFIFSLLQSFHHAHYYASLYYSFFFVLAYMVYHLAKRAQSTLPVVIVGLCTLGGLYVFSNVTSSYYNYLHQEGSNQVQTAERIAASIVPRVTAMPYQVVALPSTETSGHVRYFLEVQGKTPLPEESALEAEEIIVLCPNPEAECEPLGTPQWQLAAFHNPEIAETWTAEGVTIYKIVHKNEE
jgi:hypothetical protein